MKETQSSLFFEEKLIYRFRGKPIKQSRYSIFEGILGAVLWQWVVRQIEEKYMKNRFGDEYEVYKKKVRYWIPKR